MCKVQRYNAYRVNGNENPINKTLNTFITRYISDDIYWLIRNDIANALKNIWTDAAYKQIIQNFGCLIRYTGFVKCCRKCNLQNNHTQIEWIRAEPITKLRAKS